jgi:hypothetical protein
MVGEAGILSGVSFAQSFASTRLAAARPNFELQFNNLQNSIIDRLNEKINEAQKDSKLNNQIDVFLLAQEKKLTRFQSDLDLFTFNNARNINAVGELARRLDDLSTALGNGDTAAFDKTLSEVSDIIGNTVVTNGTTIGIYISDGIETLRRDGLLQYDNAGTSTKATAYSDFADQAEAEAAIASAIEKVGQISDVLLYKAEGAEVLRQKTATNLNSTLLQIQAAQTAVEAEKAAEIAKLRDEYAQLLNAISLAFESSQALSEQLSAKLFSPDSVPPGSAVNILL